MRVMCRLVVSSLTFFYMYVHVCISYCCLFFFLLNHTTTTTINTMTTPHISHLSITGHTNFYLSSFFFFDVVVVVALVPPGSQL